MTVAREWSTTDGGMGGKIFIEDLEASWALLGRKVLLPLDQIVQRQRHSLHFIHRDALRVPVLVACHKPRFHRYTDTATIAAPPPHVNHVQGGARGDEYAFAHSISSTKITASLDV
eukprot:SAG11_NODE_7_length_31267_cov_19.541966_3_plen_116_part_00